MGLFTRRNENRASGEVQFDDALLQALLGSAAATKQMAMQIPTVSGGIALIADIVAGTPVKLYMDKDGKAAEVKGDARVALLNDETGDTLNANEFWHALIRDYYTGKGGYAYINRSKGKIKSLHYVDEERIAVRKNTDPIFKDYDLLIDGKSFKPWDFFKILRNTKDGATGTPITEENSKLIAVAYQQLLLEYAMAKRGGNKKGFLKAEKRVDSASLEALKSAWSNLYGNERDSVVVLNNGLTFQECSDTSAEMQLDENKRTNAGEFAKIFHVSADAISGKASDIDSLAKLAAIPLMNVIQCALNRDFLLEREKGKYYWAFDTKELLKGGMKDRFEAYKIALDANFMQIDEVRYAEDLEPLGLSWIKLGLQDVLYDPVTKQVYTPNTNQLSELSNKTLPAGREDTADGTEDSDPSPQDAEKRGDISERGGNYIKDPTTGKMNGSTPAGGTGSNSGSNSQLTNSGSAGTIQSSQKPNWSKEEREKPFDYYEMQDDKTGYPRHLKATRFSSEDTYEDHMKRHSDALGCKTKEEYIKNANDFLNSPRGKDGDAYVRQNGDACRYDYATTQLVIVTKNGIIKTNWKLGETLSVEKAAAYWQKDKVKHGKY